MATVINLPRDPREQILGDLAKSFGAYKGKQAAPDEFAGLIEAFSNTANRAKEANATDAASVIQAADPKDLERFKKATKGDPVKIMQIAEKIALKADKNTKKGKTIEVEEIGKPGTRATLTIPPEIADDHDKIEQFANKRNFTLVKSQADKQGSEKEVELNDWIEANKQFIQNNKLSPSESRNAARLASSANRRGILKRFSELMAVNWDEDQNPIWGEAEKKAIQVANGMYDTLTVIAKGNEQQLERLWTDIATGVARQENQSLEDAEAARIADAAAKKDTTNESGIFETIGKFFGRDEDKNETISDSLSTMTEAEKQNLRFKAPNNETTITWEQIVITAKKHKKTEQEVINDLGLKRIK